MSPATARRVLVLLVGAGLCAIYAFFAASGARRELREAANYREAPLSAQIQSRVNPGLPAIRSILDRTPPDARILLDDVEEVTQPLFVERTVAYWVYPRRVFSTDVTTDATADRERFIEERGIDWVHDAGGLRYLGTGRPPAAPTTGHLEERYRGHRLPGVLALALTVLYFLLAGGVLLSALGLARKLTRAECVSVEFLLGAGSISAWVLLCAVTGLGLSAVTVAAPILPLGWLCWNNSRRTQNQEPNRPLRTPYGRLAGAGLLAMLVAMLLVGSGRPMTGWDARMQWAHKAQILAEEGTVWTDEFQDPATVQFHPRYPLLLPAAEAIAMVFGASRPEIDLKPLFPLFWAAMLGVLLLALRHTVRGPPWPLIPFALLPYWWGYKSGDDSGAGFTGCADIVLVAFLAAALTMMLLGFRLRDRRYTALSALLLIFAGLTKAEGLAHVGVLLCVAGPWALLTGGWQARLRTVACLSVPVVILGLYQMQVVRQTPVGTLPDDYSQVLGFDYFFDNLPRFAEVLGRFFRDLFLLPRHGFVGWLLLLAGVLGRKRLLSPEVGLPLGYAVLMLGAFSVPYTVLPIYEWSSGRLFSQILPAAFLPIIAVAVSDARPPKPTAPGHRIPPPELRAKPAELVAEST